MADRFVVFLSSVSVIVGADVFFIIFSCVVTVCFLIDLFFSVFKSGYGIKKRAWFFFLAAGISALSFALSFFSGYSLFFPFFFLGIGLILSVPIVSIRKKVARLTEEDKKFIDYIDDEILKERDIEEKFAPRPQKIKKIKDPDFSHVKSVIKRLSEMDLTATDRKEVREFEAVVYQAEKSGAYSVLKEKINDGLGLLLKLMAKYGA